MSKQSDFNAYLEEQVKNHSIYVWGAQGQTGGQITESWIRSRETSAANASRAIAFWKKQIAAGYGDKLRAFDCSGLAVYWLLKEGVISKDMNANGLKGACAQLTRAELKKGDWVFRVYTSGSNKGRAYHIGYIVDDNLNVIEAKGRDDGVVKRNLNASGTTYWNAYGRPKYFAGEAEDDRPVWRVERLLQRDVPMLRGDDVKELQTRLIAGGYATGQPDGVFGPNTENGVKRLQAALNLTVDGKAGRQVVTALGGVWAGETSPAWSVSRLLKRTVPLMSGDDVLALKQALVRAGVLDSASKNTFGDDTKRAVERFQAANDLTVDGIAGRDTVTALGGTWLG